MNYPLNKKPLNKIVWLCEKHYNLLDREVEIYSISNPFDWECDYCNTIAKYPVPLKSFLVRFFVE